MTYFVNKYDGVQIAAVADGAMDTTSTSIKLVGRDFVNYGEVIVENLVHMLEHFASPTPPTGVPLCGQLWYRTTDFKLHVYTGSQWVLASSITIGNTNGNPNANPDGPNSLPPSGNSEGELYWDEDTQQLWAWTFVGSTPKWLLVGPAAPANTDTSLNYQNIDGKSVLVIKVAGENIAIWSSVQFTPTLSTWAAQFPTIYSGLTFRKDVFNTIVSGTHTPTVTNTYDLGTSTFRWNNVVCRNLVADSMSQTGGTPIAFSKFWRSNQTNTPETTNTYDLGSPTAKLRTVYAQNIIADSLGSTPSANFMRTDSNNLPTVTNTFNLGSTSSVYANIYATNVYGTNLIGTATSARYADVAERYRADEVMEPGDVVKIGGVYEITKTTEMGDIDVVGVISTNPALRMNEDAGTDETHPFVALIGRVPCKVIGPVKKGQRLISSSVPGVACAANTTWTNQTPSWIGRALVDKETDDIGLVEIIVGR